MWCNSCLEPQIISPQYHANLAQPIKYKDSHIFAIFVLVLFGDVITFRYVVEIVVTVPVAIFFPMVDSFTLSYT